MLRGADILCLSSIDWDFNWQGHQEIMSAFAREGNRVLFVENTGVRTPGWRDLPRLRHRLASWRKGTKGFRQVQENLFVYSPIILPFPYARLIRRINRWLLITALERWMRATGFRRPLLWTFLPTPLARDLIGALDPELTVYYCIDDFASSSPQAKRIRQSETRLLREADLVFVTSEKLRERAARIRPEVHRFSFGVNFTAFEQARHAAASPQDLNDLPGPIVGYVGGIRKEIDQELLREVAERVPEATFVMVGPLQADCSRLQTPNLLLLGQRRHEELPGYIRRFHVGIIPYVLNEYTAHIYPAKLNEYLAMGIPVVTTDLPEIRRVNEEHDGLIAVARTPQEFAQAIRATFQRQSPEASGRRIAVARQNGWDARIAQMSALVEDRLAAKRQGALRWDVSLKHVYRAARRKVAGAVIGLAVGYGLLFHSPVPWWLAEPLRAVEPPQPADAIVVFAGGVGESGKAGSGYQERVKQAVGLYRAGHAPRVIFSSGYRFVFEEAPIMKDLAVAHGIPSSAILLETQASNTHENVAFVAELLERNQWRSILLVSSPYHMRRALLSWRKTAPQIRVVPTPVPESRFYAHRHGATVSQLRGILHEYLGILSYWLRGWI
ncbi:MAG: YdcF family protein [Candidatus Omnitrophica bacterium]|nr:YdcF family protein [Candidatus Omnitrophota bacterium]